LLEPAATGWFAHTRPFDFATATLSLREDGRRFETGTPSVGAVYAQLAGLELLRQAHVDFRQGIDPQLLAQERSLRDAIQAKTESRIDLLAEQQTAAEAARIRKELEALVEQYKDCA